MWPYSSTVPSPPRTTRLTPTDSHRAEVAAGHAAKGDPHTCGMHFASGNLFRRRVLKEPLSRASAAKKNQAGKPQTCYDGFYIPKAIAGNLLRFS